MTSVETDRRLCEKIEAAFDGYCVPPAGVKTVFRRAMTTETEPLNEWLRECGEGEIVFAYVGSIGGHRFWTYYPFDRDLAEVGKPESIGVLIRTFIAGSVQDLGDRPGQGWFPPPFGP